MKTKHQQQTIRNTKRRLRQSETSVFNGIKLQSVRARDLTGAPPPLPPPPFISTPYASAPPPPPVPRCTSTFQRVIAHGVVQQKKGNGRRQGSCFGAPAVSPANPGTPCCHEPMVSQRFTFLSNSEEEEEEEEEEEVESGGHKHECCNVRT
ncbi:hypothetical protein KOW79_014255 [Hemibagrus wyckioides]|uniref:Uncharacterized protein n=1 Tax=Hemibagrus wyckioides TaxID=337641 RepID=A0A9D3SKV9_9TELE|nr:hypothetical protein KOW79_014255 [Hemibagrus wyckioides]